MSPLKQARTSNRLDTGIKDNNETEKQTHHIKMYKQESENELIATLGDLLHKQNSNCINVGIKR